MKRQGKQSKIYATQILQMSICRDEVSKSKYTEMKYCRYQYPETKKAKSNIQK